MVASTKFSNKNSSPSKKLKPALLIIVIAIIPAIFYFLFFMNKDTIPEHLKGRWVRTDGPYTIEIMKIEKDGILEAAYFNPNPINVGGSGWRLENKRIELFVELADENYPGSLYKLYFNKKTEMLDGTYYQAVAKQTFNVSFKRE